MSSKLDRVALEDAWRDASVALKEHAPEIGPIAGTALMQVVAEAAISAYVTSLVSREDAAFRFGVEKVGDLVRDAFYEGCRDMQSWNGTLGPMSEDEIFAAWTESESRKQLMGVTGPASHIKEVHPLKAEGPSSILGAGNRPSPHKD